MLVSYSARSAGARTLLVVGLAALAACKESADPARAADIVGMPPVDSVRVGKTLGLEAIELRDDKGNRLTGRRVTWTSSNSAFATVADNGTVTGVAVGSSIITARADDAVATSTVHVQEPVVSVVLFPATPSIPVGGTQQLTVAVSDRNGIALTGRTVEFSSSNTSVATVNSAGVVVAVSQGQATITGRAIQDQVSGTSNVQVVQVPVSSVTISPAGNQTVFQGSTLQLFAVLRDAANREITGRPVSWTTSNQLIATVSGAGLVSGVGLGNVQITAESEGRTGSVSVTVAPTPVANLSLSPNPASVSVGGALQLNLDLRDAGGNVLTTIGRTITWESSNRPVANVQDGVVAGVSQGTATITVTVDGKSASTTVNVTP
jgi:uncharacterized protein YjdB